MGYILLHHCLSGSADLFIQIPILDTEGIIQCDVTELNNALPGKRSVNTVQHATIEEAVFSVNPTDEPIDWLYSDHVICVYCRSVSVPRLYN
jgi:hypothetical protein